uniref:Uncharacterized protein n=1 Tax=Anguilla anguilla TaxID=7936 RepID=A0A0E9UFH2_ANGAN
MATLAEVPEVVEVIRHRQLVQTLHFLL